MPDQPRAGDGRPVPVEERYGLYLVTAAGERSLLVTAPDGGGIGTAIIQLDADARDAGHMDGAFRGRVGVLDRIDRRWIVNPYAGRALA